MVINLIRGFFLAVANTIPGVSGGTIALLMGFFEKLVLSINDVFKGSKEDKKEALKFLINLGAGFIIGLFLAVLFLSTMFTKEIYKMSSLFIGLILGSLPFLIREEKESFREIKNVVYLIIGIIIVIFLASLKVGINLKLDSLNLFLIIYIFIAGSISITAMVLPGISGSSLMFSMGLYLHIINSLKELINLDFTNLLFIGVFGLGLLFGAIFFVKLIKKAFEKKRGLVMYLIVGMMLGSIYSIVLGPTMLDVPKDPITIKTFNILFFLIGALIIYLFDKAKRRS